MAAFIGALACLGCILQLCSLRRSLIIKPLIPKGRAYSQAMACSLLNALYLIKTSLFENGLGRGLNWVTGGNCGLWGPGLFLNGSIVSLVVVCYSLLPSGRNFHRPKVQLKKLPRAKRYLFDGGGHKQRICSLVKPVYAIIFGIGSPASFISLAIC